MKKITLILTIFCSAFLVNAQTLYVMKDGVATAQYNTATEIDSIIFYNPIIVDPPSSDVPLYSLTLADVKVGTESGGGTNEWNNYQWRPGTPGENGVPLHHSYYSQANNTRVGLDVVLPLSYNDGTNKRYPVVFHLHGHGETEAAYTYNGSLQTNLPIWWTSGGLDEFIFISVGGPTQGWWSDTFDGTINAESHIINEVLSIADQVLRTTGTKAGRAIEGFSMGGFGASKIGIKYPQYFAAVGTYCGAVYNFKTQSEDPIEGFKYMGNYATIWNNDKNLYANDCGREILNTKAADVIAQGTHFLVHVGEGDALYFPINNDGWVPDLQSHNIPHTYTFASGGHNMGNTDATRDYYINILSHLTYP